MSVQLDAFERELARDPALVERILETFPPAERERVITTSVENVEVARARQMARAVAWGEFWKVEIER